MALEALTGDADLAVGMRCVSIHLVQSRTHGDHLQSQHLNNQYIFPSDHESPGDVRALVCVDQAEVPVGCVHWRPACQPHRLFINEAAARRSLGHGALRRPRP